jgi:branched-chain amino acid transport system permease protein
VDIFLQQAVNGVIIGVIYSILALGFTLAFGIMRLVNFAHGAFYMLGGFLVYSLVVSLQLPYLAAFPLAALAAAGGAIVVEQVAVRPFLGREPYLMLVSTLAVSLVLEEAAGLLYGSSPKAVPVPFERSPIFLGTVVVTDQRLFLLLVGVGTIVLLDALIRKTRLGRALRATAQNPMAASVVGVNVRAVYVVTFALASGLAALAGAWLGPLFTVSQTAGFPALFKAFTVVILGGLGSVGGAVIGGIVLGVLESLTAGYISSAYVDAISFALVIVVLLVRPQGLIGNTSATRGSASVEVA